jgi:putative ABC transport system ATP-binding protein
VAGLDAVQAGRVSFEGKTLEEWFMPEYRARAVYLHQRPALQEGSVEDNLRSVFEFSVHRHRRYDSDKARSFLERLGRGESFFERDAASLSGGEAQMVALVRALQLDPSLLLLDEPTASLDGDARARIEELILSWRSAAGGRAFLLTSHDGDQVARLCQRHFFLG